MAHIQKCNRCHAFLFQTVAHCPNDQCGGRLEMIALVGLKWGGYEATKVLGAGGMSFVLAGHRHIPLLDDQKKDAAIKVPNGRVLTNPHGLDRFRHEADALCKLKNNHVVRFLTYDEDDTHKIPALIMEMVPGETFDKLLREPPDWLRQPAVLRIGAQLAEALAASHAQEIVHRDVKPSNLMVHYDATLERPHATLIDFGIVLAALKDGGNYTTCHEREHVLGPCTPAFAAPEQVLERACTASDLFSLGVLVHYALTGMHPFPGVAFDGSLEVGELANARKKKGGAKAKRMDRWGVPLDRELCALIEQLADPNEPARRGSAAKVAIALESAATRAEHRRFVPRHSRSAMLMGGAIAAAAVIGVVWWAREQANALLFPAPVSFSTSSAPASNGGSAGSAGGFQVSAVPFRVLSAPIGPVAIAAPMIDPSTANVDALVVLDALVKDDQALVAAFSRSVHGSGAVVSQFVAGCHAMACECLKFNAQAASTMAGRWAAFEALPEFLRVAQERKAEWDAQANAALQVQPSCQQRKQAREADWEKLHKLLSLNVVKRDHKITWVKAFLNTYGAGPENPHAGEAWAAFVPWVTFGGAQWMRNEAMVVDYALCASVGACDDTLVVDKSSCNYSNVDRGSHPMNCVTGMEAEAFCRFVGGRLPTEGEWEEAATNGGQIKQPWGDAPATCAVAVMDGGGNGCGEYSTWPVCSKPSGNTTAGLCDMVGNVWEWMSTLDSDARRVFRGGGWLSDASNASVEGRFTRDSSHRFDDLGFRCLRSIP